MYFLFSYDNDAVINIKYVTMEIQDGLGASVEVTFDAGNLSWDEGFTWEYILNRGRVGASNGAAVREGDEIPLSLNFQGRFSFYKSAGDVKPWEILTNDTGSGRNTGSYTGTDATNCAPYAVNIFLSNVPGCSDDEYLAFYDFRPDTLSFDVRAGTVSVVGRCNATTPTKISAVP